MKAKEYLSQVQQLSINLEQKKLELQALRDAATHITQSFNPVRVQKSSSYDKVADNAIEIADLEEKIQNSFVELFMKRHEIIAQIQQLQNPKHIEILYKHYVEFKRLEVISVEMGYTYQYIVELHGYALKAFEKLHKDILQMEIP
jgi:RNA-splicing ligase RtcB